MKREDQGQIPEEHEHLRISREKRIQQGGQAEQNEASGHAETQVAGRLLRKQSLARS